MKRTRETYREFTGVIATDSRLHPSERNHCAAGTGAEICSGIPGMIKHSVKNSAVFCQYLRQNNAVIVSKPNGLLLQVFTVFSELVGLRQTQSTPGSSSDVN